jgi:hypothetical protein
MEDNIDAGSGLEQTVRRGHVTMVQFGPNLLQMLNAGGAAHQASDAAIAVLQGVNQIAADKAA